MLDQTSYNFKRILVWSITWNYRIFFKWDTAMNNKRNKKLRYFNKNDYRLDKNMGCNSQRTLKCS